MTRFEYYSDLLYEKMYRVQELSALILNHFTLKSQQNNSDPPSVDGHDGKRIEEDNRDSDEEVKIDLSMQANVEHRLSDNFRLNASR